MTRFLSLVSFLLAIICLTGCGPIYRTNYNYVPPHSGAGKMCISQCLQNKSMCEQSCEMRNESCKERAHEDAIVQFEAYKHEQFKNKQPIKRSVSDFDTSSSCYENCDCAPSFNSCYSACGGQVQENKVCVAFCDKQ